jgi:hypothetical protein
MVEGGDSKYHPSDHYSDDEAATSFKSKEQFFRGSSPKKLLKP